MTISALLADRERIERELARGPAWRDQIRLGWALVECVAQLEHIERLRLADARPAFAIAPVCDSHLRRSAGSGVAPPPGFTIAPPHPSTLSRRSR